MDLFTQMFFFMNKNSQNFHNPPKFTNHPGSGYIAKEIILNDYVINNSTLVVKKECFEEVGNFDEKIFISADREMFLRLAIKYKAGFIDERLTGYRIFNENFFVNLEKSFNEFIYILKKFDDHQILKNTGFKKKCYSNIYYNFAKMFFFRK